MVQSQEPLAPPLVLMRPGSKGAGFGRLMVDIRTPFPGALVE